MSIFTKVQRTKVRTNTFDLSHDRKMSLKMGELTPIHCMELVPGDKVHMSTSQMLRFVPLIAPVMHRVNVYTHFFFVPNRIMWNNWEDFITGGEHGDKTPAFPYLTMGSVHDTLLHDYLGLPTYSALTRVSALPFFAYQKIWNEYFRDQNLQDPIDYELSDGNNGGFASKLKLLRKRAWQHDYFTSALPWTQKGAEATIPLIGEIDVKLKEPLDPNKRPRAVALDKTGLTGWVEGGDTNLVTGVPPLGSFVTKVSGSSLNQAAWIDPNGSLVGELSSATASSINDLRRAFKLQEWLEKNARGGSRYTESIMSHFGVRSSDQRLQRPEYLGGGKSPVTISEVLQTSTPSNQGGATGGTPQGNMAGHGIAVGANNSFSYYAEEHGYIIGIMSVLPKTAYQQGIPKHFMKFDKFDYYWPSFAHLGEQPILNKELYADGHADDENVFGYTPRYAEYKYLPSTVHGEFRSTLDFWHMGRKFANRPQLNEEFISSDPTTRIFAVQQGEQLYAHIFHRIKATRPMPYFGTPSF